MERRGSTQSLPSRGSSELGSHYQMESGLYITSFAATIFVAALATVGFLFLTLLTTLVVMLRSCENKNNGVIEFPKTSDEYIYCRIVALQAELNTFEGDDFPSVCKSYADQYIKEGQYLRDLNLSLAVVQSYFSRMTPQGDGMDVVLVDIDDIFMSNDSGHTSLLRYRIDRYDGNTQVWEAKLQARALIIQLHLKLQASGWSLILVTRKPEEQRNATIDSLMSSGYKHWTSLIMRSDDEVQIENWEYFSIRRAELQKFGFRIISTISSRMDALTGPCLGKRIFKLPNLLVTGIHAPTQV